MWDHSGITLGSLRCHFGALGRHFGVTLGILWGHFGVTVGSHWRYFVVTFRATSVLLLDYVGVALRILWCYFVVTLGRDVRRAGRIILANWRLSAEFAVALGVLFFIIYCFFSIFFPRGFGLRGFLPG